MNVAIIIRDALINGDEAIDDRKISAVQQNVVVDDCAPPDGGFRVDFVGVVNDWNSQSFLDKRRHWKGRTIVCVDHIRI